MDNKEPFIEYRPRLDNIEVATDSFADTGLFKLKEIPWDCLTELRRSIVYSYMYEQLDFQQIAEKFNLNNKAKACLEFYYALTTLSEFGIMRDFIAEQSENLTDREKEILNFYYVKNTKMKQIAKNLDITVQAVQQTISRVINRHNIEWQVFVKKEGKKVIYNTMDLLK